MNDEGRAASQPVGVVGLGLVGRALAERLAAAGFVPCGFDIDPARRAAAEARGLACAETLGDLARRCTIALIVVYDGTQAASVCTEMGKAAPRQLDMLISITTCLPGEIEALSRAAAEHNLDFIEMPISGTSAEIAAGTATGLVAGSAAALARAEAILAALCPRRIPVGGLGQASRMKLAINLVLQLNRAALAEGIAFAEALGLEPSAFLDAAQSSAAASAVMATKGRKMVERDFAPQSRLAQTLKDATLILAEGHKAGLALPLTTRGADLLRDAIARCGENADSSAVIEAIAAPRSLPC